MYFIVLSPNLILILNCQIFLVIINCMFKINLSILRTYEKLSTGKKYDIFAFIFKIVRYTKCIHSF